MFDDAFDCSACVFADPKRCDFRRDFTLLEARRRALAANPRPPDLGLETFVYEALVKAGTAHYGQLAERVSNVRGQWIDPGAVLEVLFKRRDLFLDMAYGRFRAVTTNLSFSSPTSNLWLRLPRYPKVIKDVTISDAYRVGAGTFVMQLLSRRCIAPAAGHDAPRISISELLSELQGWKDYPTSAQLERAQEAASGDLAAVGGIELLRDIMATKPRPNLDAAVNVDEIIVSGDEARTRLIELHLHMVASIANGHAGRGIEFVDLCQIGVLGLIRAIESFDPSRGFALSTYATQWIRQFISRAIADQGRAIRIPVHLYEKSPWLAKEHIPHGLPAGVRPTLHPMLSLDSVPETVLPSVDWVDEVEDRASMYRLNAALDSLTPRERDVVERRTGLAGRDPETLEQVGATFNLTRDRIRQIEAKAFKKLRRSRLRLRQLLRP